MVGRCALRVVVTSKDRAAVRLSLLSPLSCFLAPLAEAFLSLSAAPLILLMALAKDASSNRLRSVLDTRIYQTADCVAAMAKSIGQWDSLLFFLLFLSSFINSFISDQMTFLGERRGQVSSKMQRNSTFLTGRDGKYVRLISIQWLSSSSCTLSLSS